MLGSAYHYALECYDKARAIGIPVGSGIMDDAGFISLVNSFHEQKGNPFWESRNPSLEDLRESLSAAFNNFWLADIDDEGMTLERLTRDWKPVSVEEYHTDGVYHGYPDAIYEKPDGTRVVVDHKSAGSWNRWRNVDGTKVVEAAAYAKLTGIREVEWHVVRTTFSTHGNAVGARRLQYTVDDGDFASLEQTRELAEAIVRADVFPPNPDSFLCSEKWCALFDDGLCGAGRGPLGGDWKSLSARLNGDGTLLPVVESRPEQESKNG